MPCIFCEIVAGESAAPIICRRGDMITIHDTAPQAPTHMLVCQSATSPHSNAGRIPSCSPLHSKR